MNVCYNNLLMLLIDKCLKKIEFAEEAGISQSAMAKISKNEFVLMEVIVMIGRTLNCE